MSHREKFYIAIHPFPEDLKLEPPSLINYCLPVLTEKLVDTYPRKKYLTGRESDSFQKFAVTSHSEQPHHKILQQLRIPSLTKNVMWDILCDMQAMGSDDKQGVFLLYSLAYASGRLEGLRECMNDEEAAKILQGFIGGEE